MGPGRRYGDFYLPVCVCVCVCVCVSYVIANSMGQAGDQTEVSGVSLAFGATRDPTKPLWIGSVKSNIGHSEPAAGISGLLKAVLCIENGTIPGNPTFIDPNPKSKFGSLPVVILHVHI
jgi:acyl transferase domain-containing protein